MTDGSLQSHCMRDFQCGMQICLNFRILGAAYIRLHARTYPNLETNKKLIAERSRECHNHKPQPTHDTKRKRKRTEIINSCNINKQMHEKHLVRITDVVYAFSLVRNASRAGLYFSIVARSRHYTGPYTDPYTGV